MLDTDGVRWNYFEARQYLADFFEEFDYPIEARESLLSFYDAMCANKSCQDGIFDLVAQYKHELVFNYEEAIGEAEALLAAAGLNKYEGSFIFISLLTKQLRKLYRERGLSEELYRAGVLDLRYKLLECKEVQGVWGTFVGRWFRGLFRMNRMALGRLQFHYSIFRRDYVGQGITLTPDSHVLWVHIPRTGERLDYEAVKASYDLAIEFFSSWFKNEPIVFACHSWLFYSKTLEALSPKSNIYKFVSDYHIFGEAEDKDYKEMWRLFDRKCDDIESLPADSSLRRAYIDVMRRGEPIGSAWAIYVPDVNFPKDDLECRRNFLGARYIKCDKTASKFSFCDPLPFFRRELDIEEDIREARVFIQAPSFARVFINGREITEDKFISPTSDYTKILWYNSYDVSGLLRKGRNAVGVICGNGFFNEPFRTPWGYDKAYWRDAPQFMLRLEVNGETALVRDEGWRASKEVSHIIYSHLRSGEYVDMRKYGEDWLLVGYDDSGWRSAIDCGSRHRGRLIASSCPPVRETECIAPVSVTKNEHGYLVDFGATVSGYAEIRVRAEEGREITLRYAEDISPEGYPKHNRMDRDYFYPDCPFQVDKLIASGKEDSFKPSFTYHGFRYALIEGLSDISELIDVKAYFTHNTVERKSDFTSGDKLLDYIYHAGIRSTESNMFWCLTDCPTREKLGWTNDSQATAEQALINFDIISFYEKWFEDIKADMLPDGSLHGTIPTHTWGLDWGPVCDCFLYELPYRIYLYTGKKDMLVGAIPYFERYVDFLEKSIEEKHEFILGDWLGRGSSPLIPKEFVRDFYMIKALRITALAHKLSGTPSERIEKKLAERKFAFLDRYTDCSGYCMVHEQTAVAMMMSEGLMDNKKGLKTQLVDIIKRDGMRGTYGMVGVQYIYNALSMCGRPDIAYKLITESEPGYKTWYESGADTLWECWDGKDNGSHNHHMFSGVLAWFFTSLLGIAPKEEAPAFEEIELQPAFVREIGFVKGYTDTVRGRIEAEWRFEDGGFTYKVTLPKGVKATFRGAALSEGENIFII